MVPTNLILLTADFPYGTASETFLETEIDFLCERFDNVTIISTSSQSKIRYEEPTRFKHIRVNLHDFKLYACLKAALKMFAPITFKEVAYAKKHLKTDSCLNMLTHIFKYYYMYEVLGPVLENEISKNENDCIAYSYWLSSRAYTLSQIKKNHDTLKTVSRAHGFDAFVERGFIPFRREMNMGMDEIYFISQAGLENYKKNILPLLPEKQASLFVSMLGVIPQNAKSNISPKGTLTIVTASSVIELKRLDIIIKSLALIDHININWIHFGNGELFHQITSLANDLLKNKTNITYEFKGQVECKDILNYYEHNTVDIFLNSSDYEGIPVSIMEAMNCGIPVIARDVGGMSEIVFTDKNGFLLNSNAQASEFARTIEKISGFSKDDRNKLRAGAIDTVERLFNARTNYVDFIDSICDTKF